MTDLHSLDPASQTIDAGSAPIGQPVQPRPGRFTLAQSARSLRRAPVRFSGRVARSEYWWGQLLLAAATGTLSLLLWLAQVVGVSFAAGLVLGAMAITLVIAIGLGSRRLHDSDRSGWLQLLVLIPLVGWIALFVMLVWPGSPGENRHGTASLPIGDRRSLGVVALTIVGLVATLALSVAVTGGSFTVSGASVAAAIGAVDAASSASASVPVASTSATPEPTASVAPTLTAQEVGGCWSAGDAHAMIAPVACDTPNAEYVVTAVVDDSDACDGSYAEAEDGIRYLCLTKRE